MAKVKKHVVYHFENDQHQEVEMNIYFFDSKVIRVTTAHTGKPDRVREMFLSRQGAEILLKELSQEYKPFDAFAPAIPATPPAPAPEKKKERLY
jgi:hypothetical protein